MGMFSSCEKFFIYGPQVKIQASWWKFVLVSDVSIVTIESEILFFGWTFVISSWNFEKCHAKSEMLENVALH